MNSRERGFHARGAHPTQWLRTARVKLEKSRLKSKKDGRKEREHEGEKYFNQGLTSAEDLTIELPDSPYH